MHIDTFLVVHTGDINLIVENFTVHVISAAKLATKQHNIQQTKRTIPRWNSNCTKIVRNSKTAYNKYKRHRTIENLVLFKKTRANARQTIVQNKENSSRDFVSTINSSTTTQKLWENIRRVKGLKKINNISTLIEGPNIITEPNEITETIANHFAQNSSNNNYHTDFIHHKHICEREVLDLHDLRRPNSITAELIKNLPQKTKQHPLDIFNMIWNRKVYPMKWREAITIPLLKPG